MFRFSTYNLTHIITHITFNIFNKNSLNIYTIETILLKLLVEDISIGQQLEGTYCVSRLSKTKQNKP